VLIQARAAGVLNGSLAELREVAGASARTVTYDPETIAARPAPTPASSPSPALTRSDHPGRRRSAPDNRKAPAMTDSSEGYDRLASRLSDECCDVERAAALAALVIETPRGVRRLGHPFRNLPQAGRPRDAFRAP